jgi:hypothetical protein
LYKPTAACATPAAANKKAAVAILKQRLPKAFDLTMIWILPVKLVMYALPSKLQQRAQTHYQLPIANIQ